jgi:hypothetical protein
MPPRLRSRDLMHKRNLRILQTKSVYKPKPDNSKRIRFMSLNLKQRLRVSPSSLNLMHLKRRHVNLKLSRSQTSPPKRR